MFKIQWYPGHMNKAKNKIIEQINNIDIVIEVIDARIPYSSSNPIIKNLIKDKEHIIILNKSDLAKKKITLKWINELKKINCNVLSLNSKNQNSSKKIILLLKKLTENIFSKRKKKGLLNRPLRCMILGISNVGKSSLINNLANKKILKIGKKPGVTKGNQWIKIDNKIELLDTPGILWPKFKEKTSFYLAITGAISELVFDQIEIAIILINLIIIKSEHINNNLNLAEIYLKNYCKKIGALKKGNKIDLKKGALIFLKNFRNGKFGNITLEFPEEKNE